MTERRDLPPDLDAALDKALASVEKFLRNRNDQTLRALTRDLEKLRKLGRGSQEVKRDGDENGPRYPWTHSTE